MIPTAAFAVSGIWNGGTGDWWTDANWSASPAPGAIGTTNNSDTATFNTGSGTVTVDDLRNLQTVAFGTGAGAYTLNGGRLVFSNGGGITMAATLSGTDIAETINAPVVLGGVYNNYYFTNNSATASDVLRIGGTVTIGTLSALNLNGANTGQNVISGVIANGKNVGDTGLTKSGAGTWILSAANTATGATDITGGTLQLDNSLALQNGVVKINSVNGLKFQAGLGSATAFGLGGGANETLSDIGGAAVDLKVVNFYAYSWESTYAVSSQ